MSIKFFSVYDSRQLGRTTEKNEKKSPLRIMNFKRRLYYNFIIPPKYKWSLGKGAFFSRFFIWPNWRESYLFCCTYLKQQITRPANFEYKNMLFLLKFVFLWIGSKMCLMCAYHTLFLSQTKLHEYVLFWHNYYPFTIFTRQNIFVQVLMRSKFG